nr:PREDICTED: transient receptor potential cation channel subfamily V member 3-like [Latimeria chalumnae]|eukprot:XP_014354199.1 PREDICTED: transient receptor potential cation channel subfamily V member 3-like [Latimeria chalumnae]
MANAFEIIPLTQVDVGDTDDHERATDLGAQPEDTTSRSSQINQSINSQEETGDIQRALSEAISDGNLMKLQGILATLPLEQRNIKVLSLDKGKTYLMYALLENNEQTKEIVELLLQFAEENNFLEGLLNAEYTDHWYKGQTALHIAIERRQTETVKLLIEKGADVNARATGTFFQNKQNGFYFGETPLGLAACTKNKEIVNLLVASRKINVAIQDSNGNTALHAFVIIVEDSESNDIVKEIYETILKKSPDINLETVQNRDELTPLQLAAKYGKKSILKFILTREIMDKDTRHLSRKFTQCIYGPSVVSYLDLTGLDTSQKNSVLYLIIYNSHLNNRHELVNIDLLNTVLELKWMKFASCMFYISIFLHFLYNCALSGMSYFNHGSNKSIELHPLRYSDLTSVLSDAWFHFLFILQATFVIFSSILYWINKEQYQIFLALAISLGWTNMVYYTRGFQILGTYGVMVQKVMLDITKFLFVYALFLVGYGVALSSLDNCAGEDECSPYSSFKTAVTELFKLTLGLGDLEIPDTNYPELYFVLLVLYIILTFVLLLNILIVLMNESVGDVSKDSETIWKLQKARIILDLEKLLKVVNKKYDLGEDHENRKCYSMMSHKETEEMPMPEFLSNAIKSGNPAEVQSRLDNLPPEERNIEGTGGVYFDPVNLLCFVNSDETVQPP